MPANNNQPLGLLPWRLTAAPPGTLDILIDVQDPVSWDYGNQTAGEVLNPLAGRLPVITGRNVALGLKGKFVLFIPDSDDRDDVMDALIEARLDSTAPYYTWRALDGSKIWKVQFDTSEQMTIGYIAGHRVVNVTFIRLAPDEAGTAATAPIPPEVPAEPTVQSFYETIHQNGKVFVTWTGIQAPSPSDFIAVFLRSNPNVDTANQFGRLNINAAHGTGNFTFNDSLLRTDFDIRMYLGVGPKVIHGNNVTRVDGATFTLDTPATNTDVLGFGNNFVISWSGIPNPNDSDRIEVTAHDQFGTEYSVGTYPTDGDADGSATVPVPESIPMADTASFVQVTFTLYTTDNEPTAVNGRMAPLFAHINNVHGANTIPLTWGGIATVAGGDQIGIIPDGDTDITNAYATLAIPTAFGSHTFDLGTDSEIPDETLVRGIIQLADGRIAISPQLYVINNEG